MYTSTTTTIAIEMVRSFAAEWDRQEWMLEHGDWASAQWDDERREYAAALEAARDASAEIASGLEDAPDESRVDAALDLDDAIEAARGLVAQLERLRDASAALDGAVRVDESDYIAEGLLDPDGLRDECDDDDLIDSSAWQGWDCQEGMRAYLLGDGRVVMNWWRNAYGRRHERDLWVLVGTVDMGEDGHE